MRKVLLIALMLIPALAIAAWGGQVPDFSMTR